MWPREQSKTVEQILHGGSVTGELGANYVEYNCFNWPTDDELKCSQSCVAAIGFIWFSEYRIKDWNDLMWNANGHQRLLRVQTQRDNNNQDGLELKGFAHMGCKTKDRRGKVIAEWVSNCCLTPTHQFFSYMFYIMVRTC